MRLVFWAVVGFAALVAAAAVCLVLLTGRTQDGPAQEMSAYVRELKDSTPYQKKAFVEKGLKAQSYVEDAKYGHLTEVILEVPPVRLRDSVTGRESRYTRARLTLNNPAPMRLGSHGTAASFPEPWGWAKVEMLP